MWALRRHQQHRAVAGDEAVGESEVTGCSAWVGAILHDAYILTPPANFRKWLKEDPIPLDAGGGR